MPIPNKIETQTPKATENTVYFYPEKVKISYSSLEDLKYYLSKVYGQNLRLEEKQRQGNVFLRLILRNLYRQGVLQEDHTMVITDPMIEKEHFSKAVKEAFKETTTSKITHTRLTKYQIYKRQLFASIFLKKEKPVTDFFKLSLNKGTYYSRLLDKEIDLHKHASIKFRPAVELEEYIVNILTRKALLSQGCSVVTLNQYIYIIIELVIWYSRAYSLTRNEQIVTPETLLKSLKLVDQYYIADTGFINMLQGSLVAYTIKLLN